MKRDGGGSGKDGGRGYVCMSVCLCGRLCVCVSLITVTFTVIRCWGGARGSPNVSAEKDRLPGRAVWPGTLDQRVRLLLLNRPHRV